MKERKTHTKKHENRAVTEVDNLTNVLFMHGSVNCTVYIIHAHTVNVLQKSFLVFTEPTCIVTIRSSLQGDLKRTWSQLDHSLVGTKTLGLKFFIDFL